MIDPREISVVIQGPCQPDLVPRAVDSVRRVLPGAQVILSTWEGTEVPAGVAARVDLLLLNPDPGTMPNEGILSPHIRAVITECHLNLNRQLVSSRNGLLRADRPYAIKMRVDMEVEHTGFLAAFERFRNIRGPLPAFEQRIVTTNARAPSRSYALFVQDFCYFGTTPDMLRLWDIPRLPDRAALMAMSQDARDALLLVPEQYILVNGLKKAIKVPLANAIHTSPELIRFCQQVFASNLICMDAPRFGMRCNKLSLEWVNGEPRKRYTYPWLTCASYAEFLDWCRTCCEGDLDSLIAEFGPTYAQEVAEAQIKDTLVRLASHGVV